MKGKMLIFSIILLSIIIASPCYAWFEKQGVRAFYGESNMTSIGPTPSEVDSYSWGSISYLLEKSYYPWLDLQTTLGVGYLESDLQSSPSVEGRILLKVHYSIFHLAIGGGLAHLFEPKNMPDLANSWMYGLITGEVGIHFIEEENLDLRAGYVVDHISSPFHQGQHGDNQDPGWNVGGIVVTLTWRF